MANYQLRNLCFTWNNPPANVDTRIRDWMDTHVSYCVYQQEIGEKGTPHIQGYLELKKRLTMSSLKSKLGSTIHFENRRGTQAEAIAYCMKEDTRMPGTEPIELGTRKKRANETKGPLIRQLKAMIDAGATNKEMWEENFEGMSKHYRAITEYRAEVGGGPQREFLTEFEFHFGKPGSGKTEWVLKKYPGAYWKPPTSEKWYDDYKDHEVVVFDEFKGWVPYAELNKLGDSTPYSVQVKGQKGGRQWLAKRLVIISNYLPQKWYNWDKHDQEALYRRLNRGGGIWFHWKDDNGFHAEDVGTIEALEKRTANAILPPKGDDLDKFNREREEQAQLAEQDY